MAYLGFQKLQSKVEAEGKSPAAAAAIAASVGRKKYGAKKMARAARTRSSLKGAKPVRK
jgi:hypothetical protein